MAEQASTTPTDADAALLKLLDESDFTELLVAIRCGQLEKIKCLCDPTIRQAARLLYSRYNTREVAALFSALCGCQVVKTTTPAATVPASFPTPDIPAVKTDTPPPPAVKCPDGLPAKGSFTS